MTQIKTNTKNFASSEVRNSFQYILSQYASKYAGLLETISRRAVPFGKNRKVEKVDSSAENQTKTGESSKNRYSVIYSLKAQYHHVGCSSQEEAQAVLGMLMSDGNRIPVGIYDSKTDQFEWEIIGQYFHSQDPISDQRRRQDEILIISRALRRRDSSWQPGLLQKPSFFA